MTAISTIRAGSVAGPASSEASELAARRSPGRVAGLIGAFIADLQRTPSVFHLRQVLLPIACDASPGAVEQSLRECLAALDTSGLAWNTVAPRPGSSETMFDALATALPPKSVTRAAGKSGLLRTRSVFSPGPGTKFVFWSLVVLALMVLPAMLNVQEANLGVICAASAAILGGSLGGSWLLARLSARRKRRLAARCFAALRSETNPAVLQAFASALSPEVWSLMAKPVALVIPGTRCLDEPSRTILTALGSDPGTTGTGVALWVTLADRADEPALGQFTAGLGQVSTPSREGLKLADPPSNRRRPPRAA